MLDSRWPAVGCYDDVQVESLVDEMLGSVRFGGSDLTFRNGYHRVGVYPMFCISTYCITNPHTPQIKI